jgi:hypothetical protein
MDTLTERQAETLQGVEFNFSQLNSEDIGYLLDQGYIVTEWSNYGLRITEKGIKYLDDNSK